MQHAWEAGKSLPKAKIRPINEKIGMPKPKHEMDASSENMVYLTIKAPDNLKISLLYKNEAGRISRSYEVSMGGEEKIPLEKGIKFTLLKVDLSAETPIALDPQEIIPAKDMELDFTSESNDNIKGEIKIMQPDNKRPDEKIRTNPPHLLLE